MYVFNFKWYNVTEEDINFHEEVVEYLKTTNLFRVEEKNPNKFFFWFNQNDLQKNLHYFVEKFRDKTIKLLKKYSLEDKYIISEEELQRKLRNIQRYKNGTTGLEPIIIDPVIMQSPKDNRTKNIILYGPPGVGKTHNTKKLIALLETVQDEANIFNEITHNALNDDTQANQIIENIQDRVKFITFHQSFGYEDFIEGFRPNENGDIRLQDGIFKTICNHARNDRNNNYYLVIDEINRGNISKIFGELITLIEEDKRDDLKVTLPYSKESFSIPSNLYIIGTMNSTDKSIALIDIALRRRFTFLKMQPNPDLIEYSQAKALFIDLNKKIAEKLGDEYQIGHSYFMNISNDSDLSFVLGYKIKPLLEEYFYGDIDGYNEVIAIIEGESGGTQG